MAVSPSGHCLLGLTRADGLAETGACRFTTPEKVVSSNLRRQHYLSEAASPMSARR